MTSEEIKEQIYHFISKHEILISDEAKKNNKDARFTSYGNKAGLRAIYEIMEMMDDDMKSKVLEMMKNKKL